jgi:transposase
MGRTKALIGEPELALAISERESLSDWKLVHKLTAIIAYANHSARQVGEMLGTTTETVIRWASAFRRSGLDGLRDRVKGHRPRRLDAAAEQLVREWVTTARDADGKRVHWTLKRLCLEAHRRLGVTIGHTAMGESLHRLGLAVKRPRPSHYQADPARAAEFKKKPQSRPGRSARSTRTGSSCSRTKGGSAP